MTEKEKMKLGMWYDANNDIQLIRERTQTMRECQLYNQAPALSPEAEEILRRILGKEELPAGLIVLPSVFFDYGTNTHFGESVFVNHHSYFMDGAPITVGSHCFVGPFCGFYTASHPTDAMSRNRGKERALPIEIGDNCWIGANVSVMPGVTIGSGCVIAAGAVVTHDIPDDTVAAGVPARPVRKIEQK
ncbi:MAG: sugar O-acetyltransferase [Bilifractor sp.]|jgi:acetyltransferase-like isoleucine patch superfamily enzyme